MSVQLSAGFSERLYSLAIGAGARRRRRASHLAGRVDPAGMHTAGELLGGLRIDLAVLEHAAEGRLEVVSRAAEPVVEVDMAEGGIEVVAPKQAHHAPAEPDTFTVGRRSSQQLRGLGKFVDFFLSILAVAGLRLLGFGVAALRKAGAGHGKKHRHCESGGQDTDTERTHAGSGNVGCFPHMRTQWVSIAATVFAGLIAARLKQPPAAQPSPKRPRPKKIATPI